MITEVQNESQSNYTLQVCINTTLSIHMYCKLKELWVTLFIPPFHAGPEANPFLKGQYVFFEVGSYKVHIYSQSVPYRNHRSAQPQFEEVESCSSPDAQLCTAVNGVQRRSEI